MLAQHQLHAAGLGGDLLGKVVDRGPQPAIDDHRVGALAGLAEVRQQARAVVADRGAPVHGQPDLAEPAGDVAVIAVDGLAGEDFVAGAEYFHAHVGPIIG